MSIYGRPEVVFPSFADKSLQDCQFTQIYMLKSGKLALEKPTQTQHVKGAF